MELRWLHYFLTVAREENITRAAEKLHLTQPTLSRQLMQLEQEIGVQLMIRGKRKIELTKAGMLLRSRAQDIITLVNKTEEDLQSDEQVEGVIKIGTAECYASHTFLPKVLSSFQLLYPKVTFDIYTGTADIIKERMERGIIDIGLLLEPVDIEYYDFLRLPYRETWGLLTSSHNPLAQQEHVCPDDLKGLSLIHSNRTIVQKEIANWFQRGYEDLHFIATYDLLSNALSLIQDDMASMITIEGALHHYTDNHIKFLPFAPELTTGVVLVWKKHQQCSSLIEKFIDQINYTLQA